MIRVCNAHSRIRRHTSPTAWVNERFLPQETKEILLDGLANIIAASVEQDAVEGKASLGNEATAEGWQP